MGFIKKGVKPCLIQFSLMAKYAVTVFLQIIILLFLMAIPIHNITHLFPTFTNPKPILLATFSQILIAIATFNLGLGSEFLYHGSRFKTLVSIYETPVWDFGFFIMYIICNEEHFQAWTLVFKTSIQYGTPWPFFLFLGTTTVLPIRSF